MGEPTHDDESLLDRRNETFRQLVEQQRYRTIALESDCIMGLVVDDYVTARTGTFDDAMERGFSHGWGKYAANGELVRWMREHNDGKSEDDMLRFAGFDAPLEMAAAASPTHAMTALHSYLAAEVDPELLPCAAEELTTLLGSDDQWTEPNAMLDPSQSVGQSAQAVSLRLLADDLAALLDMQTPHLIAATSRHQWNRSRLHARSATGLLRYHYWMADTSSSRQTRMARLCALRDSMMAANLLALAEQAPTFVYAHNAHLQEQLSSMPTWDGPIEWWSAGALVKAQLNDDYAIYADTTSPADRRFRSPETRRPDRSP